jgi:uncharacterized protein YhbP (UPF0306 family)
MELKQAIYEYLQTQRLMQLATYGDYPWIANLYYVADEEFNLYFLSKGSREHCQQIAKNPEVAVAIADSSQLLHEPQKGIQLYGTAETVGILKQIEWMAQMWNKFIAFEANEKLDPKELINAVRSRVYKIIPKRIKFFNTEVWPKDQFQVLEL